MSHHRSLLAISLLCLLASCSDPEEAKIQISGQTALKRPDRQTVNETGILVQAVGTSLKALTDSLGLYNTGEVSNSALLIEQSKEGYGRKRFRVTDYAGGPLSLVWLYPITPHLAVTGEPRYFDTSITMLERIGVKLNDRGDTIDQGTVVEKSYSQEMFAVPITVTMRSGALPTKFASVELYYSDRPNIDVMDPTSYLWMQTARFDTPQEPGMTSLYLSRDMLDWMKSALRPAGTKIYVRAFASPYIRTRDAGHNWDQPFYDDPVTKRPIFSIYESVASNASSFILH